MKRFLVLLLAVMLCLTASGMAEVALEGLPIVDEPITLTCAVQQSPIQGDFNEMVILKEFAEESNVNIEFQNIPSSDLETQLSLMLASAEVPDLLMKMNVSAATQATYAAEGMFVALSDYEEYMPNLMSWFEEYPTAKDAVTMSDGKIYGAPYILAGESIRMGGKMWFNTDLMEKVGYDTIPTTTDELLEYFRATAAYDYNENGQADEIALSAGSIDDVMYLFMGSYGLMNRGSSHRDVYVDDGELQYAYSSERFKEELRCLNQLYTEGLLDPDIFTIDFAQLIAKSSTEDAADMASIKTEQENCMKEWRAYFITGQRDIDADWDEYVAGYDGMNTARYMELYRAAREAMGVE